MNTLQLTLIPFFNGKVEVDLVEFLPAGGKNTFRYKKIISYYLLVYVVTTLGMKRLLHLLCYK